MDWTADIANDPTRDHQLCIELREGDRHRGTVFRNQAGEIRVKLYPCADGAIDVPGGWLKEILEGAENDLPGVDPL